MFKLYFYLKKRTFLFLLFLGIGMFVARPPLSAQNNKTLNFTVKGIVTSSDNNSPLPGVNVYIKGTTQGTVTDINGEYSISAKTGDILVFSFVGYSQKEVTVKNAKEKLNVSLQPQAQNLNEMVVVGYGSVKKADVSGAISKIKNVSLSDIPVARADKALMGQIAGVQIQNVDAQAGAAPNIVVRGVSSINTSNSPLIVVDGYPVPDDLSSIDMSNVASIEVLKDAASAAIYGSRASNGVIIITTKKGMAGKTVFNFDTHVGFNQPYPHAPIYSTPRQWAAFVNADAAKNGLTVPEQIPTMISLGTHTDWENLVLRNAMNQAYNFSASGGSKKFRFYIGGGYQDNQGVIITNYYKKYSLNTRIDANINKWLSVGVNINGSYSKQRVAAVGLHDATRSAGWLPLRLDSTTAVYAQAAGYNVTAGDFAHERYFTNVNGVNIEFSTGDNSYVLLAGRYHFYYTYRTAFNLHAGIKFSNNLRFKTSFGGYYKNIDSQFYEAAWSYRKNIASGYFNQGQTLNWINENTLTYHKVFGKSDITGLAGLSEQANQIKTAYMKVHTFATDNIQTLNGGANIDAAYTLLSQSTLVSTFFRLNYVYADKYILAVSSRWDGSSRFGTNNKWGTFPAVSGAWRISKENFLKNSKWISEFKLRASYGSTGNNNIGDYSSLAIVQPGYNAIFGNVAQGLTTTSIANPNLGWEKTNQFDGGIDFGALNGRVFLSVDYYNSKTKHLLLQKEIPSATGFTSTWSNMGKVQNQGFEFEITSHNIVKDNFKWTTTANFYTNRNKLINLGGPDHLISTPDSKRPSQFIAMVGQPLVQFYGYVVDHSKGDNGQVARNELSSPYWPIDVNSEFVYVKDINHDGVINSLDRVPLGSPYPKFNWAITNNFTFHNFDFSFMFQGSEGAKVYNIDSYYYHSQWHGSYASNVTDAQFLQNKVVTNWNVQNASFVTLRSLMVGYNLPGKVVDRMHLKDFKIYLNAYNLLYFMAKGYTGFNPEGVNAYNSTLTYGYQRGAMPVVRSFTLGLNIKF